MEEREKSESFHKTATGFLKSRGYKAQHSFFCKKVVKVFKSMAVTPNWEKVTDTTSQSK